VTQQITHKRGDTFDFLLELPEADYPDGYFLGWTAESKLRKPTGLLIAAFETSWADPPETTRILRIYASDTVRWPIGTQEADVEFVRVSDGLKRSTESFLVDVIRDQTY
jgi:hypothetical protein